MGECSVKLHFNMEFINKITDDTNGILSVLFCFKLA